MPPPAVAEAVPAAQEINGGGIFGDSGSFGGIQDEKQGMPEIEDVVDDDNSDLNIPKIEEDAV